MDSILKEAWNQGTILCGLSAGAICWFEEGVTDSIPGRLTPLKGLGFLKGSCSPHYDEEVERRPSYHRLLKEGKIQGGYAADDGVSFHFRGDRLHAVVSSRPDAHGFEVRMENQIVFEEEVPTHFLHETLKPKAILNKEIRKRGI